MDPDIIRRLLLSLAPKPQTTYLRPDEEAVYRAWMEKIGHTNAAGFFVSPQYTGTNYDYRGYFKENGPVNLGKDEHLTDTYKLPSHDTFSDESIYATGRAKKLAGRWEGETYIPSMMGGIFGRGQ
jgi:hypothetical protein